MIPNTADWVHLVNGPGGERAASSGAHKTGQKRVDVFCLDGGDGVEMLPQPSHLRNRTTLSFTVLEISLHAALVGCNISSATMELPQEFHFLSGCLSAHLNPHQFGIASWSEVVCLDGALTTRNG